MKTVWLGADERGEIIWHPVFLDFAGYWGFRPRLCRPYRAQTKGKIESGVKYVRRNFLCGLLGREPSCLLDFNTELREWVATVANTRVHGTTHQNVGLSWDLDQFQMQSIQGRPPFAYKDDELRKVARDAYVSWQASRYSVPWQYVGKQVVVCEQGPDMEVRWGGQRIARHPRADVHTKSSPIARTTKASPSVATPTAGRFWWSYGNRHPRWKPGRWQPTKAWRRWRQRYDGH